MRNKDNFRVAKWPDCEKSVYEICIKNAYLVLICSEFYCIIWLNKLRPCLFCIKTDDAIEKRERQKIYIERCVIFCRFFYPFFRKGDQNGLPYWSMTNCIK